MPGVATSLADEHTVGDRGDCRTCRSRWPCTLAELAADVKKIIDVGKES